MRIFLAGRPACHFPLPFRTSMVRGLCTDTELMCILRNNCKHGLLEPISVGGFIRECIFIRSRPLHHRGRNPYSVQCNCLISRHRGAALLAPIAHVLHQHFALRMHTPTAAADTAHTLNGALTRTHVH